MRLFGSFVSNGYRLEESITIDFCEVVSGFEVKVVTPENYVKRESGLIYRDFEVGKGDCPKDGQQVFLSSSLEATASFF